MIGVVFLTVFITGVIVGCATVKIWSSSPSVQTISNDDFEVSFEPLLKEAQKFYDRFQFRLKNKSDGQLIIDWQNSRYLQAERENGRFVFKGVTPGNIDSLPPDTVAPGAELAKTIAPLRLIGYERLKSRALQPGESGFSAGIIPEGEHGILLVIKQGEKKISEKIMVKISVKDT